MSNIRTEKNGIYTEGVREMKLREKISGLVKKIFFEKEIVNVWETTDAPSGGSSYDYSVLCVPETIYSFNFFGIKRLIKYLKS